jgi:hypothetical protein
MHFSSALVAALSLATGTNAWAQAADGTWVANNVVHTFANGRKWNTGNPDAASKLMISFSQGARSLYICGHANP